MRKIIATDARRICVGGDFISRGEVRRKESSIEWMLSAPCTKDASSDHELSCSLSHTKLTGHYRAHGRVKVEDKSAPGDLLIRTTTLVSKACPSMRRWSSPCVLFESVD